MSRAKPNRKPNRKPSERQKQTLANFIENGRKSVSGAMRKANFSEAYSKHPEKLARTKTWQELTNEVLNDDLLVKVHKGLLKHKDWRARDAGLDKGYKVRGRYAPEQIELTKRKYQELSDKELAELERKLKNFLLKK
jgi:hypothetical protein